MEDISKFIGIDYNLNHSSFKECDCVGLCRLFYKEHGWKDTFWDGGEAITEDNYSKLPTWRRLYKYCLTHMDKVEYENLSFGDFVIFKIDGDLHTGIYLEYGKLLSMQIPTIHGESISTIYHRNWWTPFYKYSFRRRDKD